MHSKPETSVQNKVASAYKGHTIEPLVYAYAEPKRANRLRIRRYRVGVRITNDETHVEHTTTLAATFEFFGDARRAAETHGRLMIDDPAKAQAVNPTSDPSAPHIPVPTDEVDAGATPDK